MIDRSRASYNLALTLMRSDGRATCIKSATSFRISPTVRTTMMFVVGTRHRSLCSSLNKLSHRYLSTGPVTSAYKKHMEAGNIRLDDDQLQLATRLDRLHDALESTDARVLPSNELSVDFISDSNKSLLEKMYASGQFFLSQILFPPPRGLYIHGAVGVGKSFLMDVFYRVSKNATIRRKHRRVHFHEFMLDVHGRIHNFKQRHPKGDALPAVAVELAQEARLLCFDEFQVTDIADAMILKRLFGMLLKAGVVVVATSNRAPNDLYQGGINRSLFLPFIDTLTANLDVVEMSGEHDYRRRSEKDTSSFFCPAHDACVRATIQSIFESGGEERSESIPVKMGRTIMVPKSNDTVAWFDFMDLCHQPLGAADYIALCEHYQMLIVDHIPPLNSSRFNEARRFVTLIDALYETRTRLIMTCDVPLEHLFVDFDVTVESNDGDEEIAVQEPAIQDQTGDEEMFVKGEGGSSSSAATTMIRTKDGDVEWSATGRIGVSLAQLSAVRDISFSFQRAESRLAEMNGPSWGR